MVNQKKKLKIIYKTGNEDNKVASKILKMDDNNQYENAMTKPLPTGSIKRKKISTMREFKHDNSGNSGEDKIGDLFVVNIYLDHKIGSQKQLFFIEIYWPIFEKKKVLSANERYFAGSRRHEKDLVIMNQVSR